MITIGGAFVGFDGERVVLLFLAGGTDVHQRLRTGLVEGAVLGDLLEEPRGLVHRREERDVAPELEPLPAKEADRDVLLAMEDLVVVRQLRIAEQRALVFLEGPLVHLALLIAASDEVLRGAGMVGERPDLHHAAGGLEGELDLLLVEGFLRHLELVLGAFADPFGAFAADGLISPTLTGTIDHRSGAARGGG